MSENQPGYDDNLGWYSLLRDDDTRFSRSRRPSVQRDETAGALHIMGGCETACGLPDMGALLNDHAGIAAVVWRLLERIQSRDQVADGV